MTLKDNVCFECGTTLDPALGPHVCIPKHPTYGSTIAEVSPNAPSPGQGGIVSRVMERIRKAEADLQRWCDDPDR
jgi:hypothetical protein